MRRFLKPTPVLFAAAAVTVLFWLPIDGWTFRFGSVYAAARTLGQVAGLIGLTLLAENLILSSRLPLFDRWADGLDKIYLHHRRLGITAFCLLLAHPFLLATYYLAFSPLAAWRFLMPWNATVGKAYGFAALGLLVLLIGLTFWKPLRYHLWKWSHKLMGVVFILGFGHFLVMSGGSMRVLPLKTYLSVLALLALAAWIHRAVLGGLLARRWRYRVAAVRQVIPGVWEISLKPSGPAMPFRAGQFVFLRFLGSSVGREEHALTMASAPSEPEVRFVVKELGDWSSRLGQLQPGTEVALEGPFGRFDPVACHNGQVWIAGGIGVTPFLAAVRDIARRGVLPDVAMFYCVKDAAQAVYADDLTALGERWGWLRLTVVPEASSGRLSWDQLASAVPDWRGRDYFLCGPEPMMTAWRDLLADHGVGDGHIHFERFALKK